MIALHGIGGRGDLPVPLWLAAYSAAAAVAVSFFALAAFWSRPRFEPHPTAGDPRVSRSASVSWVPAGARPLPGLTRLTDARVTRWTLKAMGVAALILLLTAAWFGNSSSARNPAPTWLYVWIWVGIIPISLLFGPVWRLASPFRTLAALVPRRSYRELPSGISSWPAVAGLAGFVWLELVFPQSSEPRVVALYVTGYAVANVAAGIVYGPAWFRVGDTFEVYAEVLARLSPLGRSGSGVVLRNPLAGLAGMPQEPGLAGLLCLLLGSTAFDGFSRWSIWTSRTSRLEPGWQMLVSTLGLVVLVALVCVVFVGAARTTGSARIRPGSLGPAGLPGAFAHSLVPIAIGYAVAHYFSFAVFQGQAGLGVDRIDYGVVGTGVIAGVQIGAIVLGHVLGVVSAHDRATALFRRRELRQAQYPMLAAMVAFTAGGIALVSAS